MRDSEIRRRLVRLTLLPGWLVVGIATVAFALGLSVPLRYQFVPLVASALVIGLPHGAVDHLSPSRARNQPVTVRSLAAVGLLYAALGGLYAVVWFLAPVAAFAFFILLTWLHWGQGEVHALTAVAGVDHLETRFQRVLTALCRGTLPMLVPLVAFPEQYRLVAETIVGLFGASSLGPASVAFTTAGRATVAVLIATLLVTALGIGRFRATDRRGWALDAGEVGLLVAFFAVVPPILAVGLFFTTWHALRHVGRLLALDPTARTALGRGDTWRALGRFVRDSTPLTVAALALLGGLFLLVPETPLAVPDLAALYLALIAMLTLPHVVVVTDIDIAQDVWTEREVLLTGRRQ